MSFVEPRREPGDEAAAETPCHGFQGDRGAPAARPDLPASVTVAVSREAGSRGGSIARRAGRLLGWQVYNQELLEYIAQEGTLREEAAEVLPPEAARWAEARLQKLLHEGQISEHPSVLDLARVALTLGAQGEVILVGRGAGYLLPPETPLHVRFVAPQADRVAYLSQWLRLPVAEAAEQVRLRDARRAEFLQTHFRRQPGDPCDYDLLLNSSLLGEELCAELIARAARAKLESWRGVRGA
jgi:cytidylate kinase